MLDRYVYTFNRFLKDRFGERVHKISLNAGTGCPNKDGRLSKEGCIFCNEEAFTFFKDTALGLKEQIASALETAHRRFKAKKFIAYFQEGSTTSAPPERLEELFDTLKAFKEIIGLFISARPDGIDKEKVLLINRYAQHYLTCIELGMQTGNDASLRFLNRNHTYRAVKDAVSIIRQYPSILIAPHLILGIPEEAQREYNGTLERIRELNVAGVKFHLFHILKNTRAEALFKEGKIPILSQQEYCNALIYFIERLPKTMFIERLISTASPDCLVAPLWMNDRPGFLRLLEEEFKRRETFQGRCLRRDE